MLQQRLHPSACMHVKPPWGGPWGVSLISEVSTLGPCFPPAHSDPDSYPTGAWLPTIPRVGDRGISKAMGSQGLGPGLHHPPGKGRMSPRWLGYQTAGGGASAAFVFWVGGAHVGAADCWQLWRALRLESRESDTRHVFPRVELGGRGTATPSEKCWSDYLRAINTSIYYSLTKTMPRPIDQASARPLQLRFVSVMPLWVQQRKIWSGACN